MACPDIKTDSTLRAEVWRVMPAGKDAYAAEGRPAPD